jgi:hypothetical protein
MRVERGVGGRLGFGGETNTGIQGGTEIGTKTKTKFKIKIWDLNIDCFGVGRLGGECGALW